MKPKRVYTPPAGYDERALIAAAQVRTKAGKPTPFALAAQTTLLRQWTPGIAKQAALHSRRRGLPFDDLLQEGSLGFLHAVNKFDLKQPWRLWTYAYRWVQVYIRNAVMASQVINMTTTQADRQLFWQAGAIEARLGLGGDDSEDHVVRVLAKRLRVEPKPRTSRRGRHRRSKEQIVRDFLVKRAAVQYPVSLDAPRPDLDGDDKTLLPLLVDGRPRVDALLEIRERFDRLWCAVDRLRARLGALETRILLRLLSENKKRETLRDIGEVFGVSSERIRQIEVELVQKLRAEYRRCEGEVL